jgi:uncharacterized Rmd1/YagE family protein
MAKSVLMEAQTACARGCQRPCRQCCDVGSCQRWRNACCRIERDNFSVCYAPVSHSKIANDEITIPLSFCNDSGIKLSISHALAQSAKLSLYEARMGELVNLTKDMPDHLARTGQVWMRRPLAQFSKLVVVAQSVASLVAVGLQVSRTRKEIAQLIGRVFIQKSNVNLLSTVLDTPEYFWSAPDNQQVWTASPRSMSMSPRSVYMLAPVKMLMQPCPTAFPRGFRLPL